MSAGAVSASVLDVAWGGLSWMTAIGGDVWDSQAGMMAPSLENLNLGPAGPGP